MPELSDALHDLYEAEARVQVSPSRAMNTLTGEARSARRRAQLRVGALAACGALVIGVGVTAGAMALKPDALQPGGTPSMTPTTVSVRWDPSAAAAAVTKDFELPQCGDVWAPEPISVDGITPVASAEVTPPRGDIGDGLRMMTYFATDGPPRTFLGDAYTYVVTQGGVVVAVTDAFENLDRHVVGASSAAGTSLFSTTTCAAQAAYQAVYDAAGVDPDADFSDEEWAQIKPDYDAVTAAHQALPAGEYTVYSVSPIVFGEQLAAAQMIFDTGYSQPVFLEWDLGSSILANDPRVAPYCAGSTDTGITCNPPQEVRDEVLTFEVDPANIDTTPSGVAISEPVTVTVP